MMKPPPGSVIARLTAVANAAVETDNPGVAAGQVGDLYNCPRRCWGRSRILWAVPERVKRLRVKERIKNYATSAFLQN